MVKKIVAALFICMFALTPGCGGSADKNPKDIQAIESNASLDEARRARDAGEPLTAKQRRILEDAEEAAE